MKSGLEAALAPGAARARGARDSPGQESADKNAWASAEVRLTLAEAARPDLPASAKVLLGLIRYHDRGSGCFASIKTLGREIGGRKPDAVMEALRLLERTGHILIQRASGRRNLIRVSQSEPVAPKPPLALKPPVESEPPHQWLPRHRTSGAEATGVVASTPPASELGSEVGSQLLRQPLRVDGWFGEFWAMYPRKVAKKAAERAFAKAVRTEARWQKVKAALEAQLPALLARDPEKRPHASTWLNQERWEDEVDPLAQTAVAVSTTDRESEVQRRFRERMERHRA